MLHLRGFVRTTILLFLLLCMPSSAMDPVFVEDFIAEKGLDVSEFGYTLQDFQAVPNDPFTIPKVMALLDDPLLIPEFTNAGGKYYLENHNKTGDLLRKCAKDSGFYLWRGWPPITESESESAWDLFTPGHDSSAWRSGLNPFLENVPEDQRNLWIRFFAACAYFIDAREEALRNIPPEKWETIRANAVDFLLGKEFDADIYDTCLDFDFNSMYRGAVILADAFDALREGTTIEGIQATLKRGRYSTPIGKILVSDTPHNYQLNSGLFEDVFFIIELSGDDSYADFCWNSSVDRPLKIVWDLTGDDYHRVEEGASGQAAGALGMALLVDETGDDEYYASNFAQGAGAFGVGILFDASGDDVYYADDVAQGAGVFGIGILADCDGNDEYSCLFGGQGFAYVRAGGLLLDVAGDDIYIARDDEVINPAAQTKEHNVSMAQGAGYGRRADFSDGHCMSGGVAFLVDGDGDDYYSTGVFGQGVGYWFGAGYLYDAGGDDEYIGIWYSQGASAHFALAGFIDVSGDDTYDTLMSQCLGNGRDLSNAIFIDLAGNDSYNVPDRSAGCGNINGFGLFVDMHGNDSYGITHSKSMGCGDLAEVWGWHIRERMDSTGVFIDAGGEDIYVFPDDFPYTCENNSSWGIAEKPGEMSLGIDGEFQLTLWPPK